MDKKLTKPMIQSKTIVASFLTFILSSAQVAGYVNSEEYVTILEALEAALPHVAIMATALLAIYGRIIASKRLTLK